MFPLNPPPVQAGEPSFLEYLLRLDMVWSFYMPHLCWYSVRTLKSQEEGNPRLLRCPPRSPAPSHAAFEDVCPVVCHWARTSSWLGSIEEATTHPVAFSVHPPLLVMIPAFGARHDDRAQLVSEWSAGRQGRCLDECVWKPTGDIQWSCFLVSCPSYQPWHSSLRKKSSRDTDEPRFVGNTPHWSREGRSEDREGCPAPALEVPDKGCQLFRSDQNLVTARCMI